MVVAEVPLWVVHSNATTPGPGARGITASSVAAAQSINTDSGDNPTTTAAATTTTSASDGRNNNNNNERRALESLVLLDGSCSNVHSVQKAAMYSVDVHGDRFATGGGDGTVRIWNIRALFPKPTDLIKNRYNKVTPANSSTVEDRTYESSGESSLEEVVTTTTMAGSITTGGGGPTTTKNGAGTTTTTLTNKDGKAAAAAAASVSSDDGEDSNVGDDVIHDLSGVVRRKNHNNIVGEGGSSIKNNFSKLPNGTPQPSMSNKPSHHNHHHTHSTHHSSSTHGQHRLLCTLSAHTGSSVLAVRFSHNGRYLASAGDDAVVCVYAQQHLHKHHTTNGSAGSATTTGNLDHHSGGATVEHWTRIKLCRGHGLDAVGLAWAPDDSHLVSCSLDSNTPIIVWKLTDLMGNPDGGGGTNGNVHHHPQYAMGYSNVLCNPYRILGRGVHTSTVKGVTFDPAGTYLASSGDDPSVCIWRAHDDWGLEKRIDSKSGIFRKWSGESGGGGSAAGSSSSALSNQSLFRRLSWSTDGAYICSTNAVVKNKHVASTISREGWAVSSAKLTASGAANLVGHKQPIVASRHCPYLLNARGKAADKDENDDDNNNDYDDDDDDPEYATLLALGDKRGFVTVWSTKKPRPVFKIQCSETRCTVTDLSWGRLPKQHNELNHDGSNSTNDGDLLLMVSLLDGQVVALRFGIPDELGKVLKPTEQARVFQLRYGIDPSDLTADGTWGARRLFVGENSAPKLIENALQFSLENQSLEEDEDDDDDEDNEADRENGGMDVDDDEAMGRKPMSADQIKAVQTESRSKSGKKRIQPLLVQTTVVPPEKREKLANGNKGSAENIKKKADTLEDAMELAEKAASGAEAVAAQKATTTKTPAEAPAGVHHHHRDNHPLVTMTPQNLQLLAGAHAAPQIPHSSDRVHSVELPLSNQGATAAAIDVERGAKYVAACTNSIHVPQGSSGSALPCTVLSISRAGLGLWKDQLPGTSCCAIAASKYWLVVGTSDGCIQIYGTSPTLGWASGNGFRSHPPYVLGRPIVALHLRDVPPSSSDGGVGTTQTELLAVISDGTFFVYVLEPNIRIRYKGSVMPAMSHMLLAADMETDIYLPKIARIQLTDTNRLLLLLSLHSVASGRTTTDDVRAGRDGNQHSPSVGAGGSLQGFVYDVPSGLWMRVADSRFVLSDFYKSLSSASRSTLFHSSSGSSKKTPGASPLGGELAKLDDAVRMGATSSTLQRSRRGRPASSSTGGFANDAYSQAVGGSSSGNDDGSASDVSSRSHCEDRMACAMALGSAAEFEFWFSMYVKTIAMAGDEALLRMVVDMLLGTTGSSRSSSPHPSPSPNGQPPSLITTSSWWLSQSSTVLNFDRVKLIKRVVIPEMSRNRSLQRLTNEIAIEVDILNTDQ